MTEDTSPENLRKFLESDDPAMRRMGLSMAKGSGVPEELCKNVFGMSLWDPKEENREAARALVKEIGLENMVPDYWYIRGQIASLKVADLKEKLREQELPVSGTKATLVSRLVMWRFTLWLRHHEGTKTIPELKEALRNKGLPVTGNKDVLIERLIETPEDRRRRLALARQPIEVFWYGKKEADRRLRRRLLGGELYDDYDNDHESDCDWMNGNCNCRLKGDQDYDY